jgi:hypothetical protein
MTGTTVVQLNHWYHVAITADSGGTQHLYVNGLEDCPPQPIGRLSTAGDRYVIGYRNGNFNYFAGEIDEVRLWSVALPASEILLHSQRNPAPTTAGLRGYWTFDEPTGQVFRDIAAADGFVNGTLGINLTPSIDDPARVPSTLPTPLAYDCDSDGVPDECQIAIDSSLDANHDGGLDSCKAQPCFGDIFPTFAGDSIINAGDLAQLLSSWGQCGLPCPADISPPKQPNGLVGPADLAQLLSNWGPCP